MAQLPVEIGKMASEIVIDMIERKVKAVKKVLEPEIIERETCAPAKSQ